MLKPQALIRWLTARLPIRSEVGVVVVHGGGPQADALAKDWVNLRKVAGGA